jgi:hypothetical protein
MYGNILENMKLKSNCEKWQKYASRDQRQFLAQDISFHLIIHNLLLT